MDRETHAVKGMARSTTVWYLSLKSEKRAIVQAYYRHALLQHLPMGSAETRFMDDPK